MAQPAIIDWSEDGAPRSRRFDDIYFSAADGLAETREVFLKGCGLPEAWADRARFTVAELGLGTGLNVLALLELWRDHHQPGQQLHVFSVEAYPMSGADMRRALAAWPRLADLTDRLAAGWPSTPGFHRIDLEDLDATLDVAVMEAAEALAAWSGRADAWFLDGFAPARNPEMWRDEVLGLVAQRSAEGARIATFTVAGAVRAGLAAHGFEAAKRPGFGNKRQRLEAWRPASTSGRSRPLSPRVCIIGAGVAGASIARALRQLGVSPVVVDAEGIGAGASGNPAALVTPRLDAGGGPAAQLYAQAFERATALYRAQGAAAVIAEGALQIEVAPRDPARFDRVAELDLWGPGAMVRLSADEAGERLGEPLQDAGLWIRDGLTIEPAEVLGAWLAGCELRIARADGLRADGGAWQVLGADGAVICEAEVVFVAAGCATADLVAGLELEPVRGQVSIVRSDLKPTAAAWGGYVIPTRDGLLYGATHDRGQSDIVVRSEDLRRVHAVLARRRPALAEALERTDPTPSARVGIRASSPDRSPVAGPAPGAPGAPGLYVLSGLGGRGFTLAPLLGEHLASLALDAPSPLPEPLKEIIDPARFSRRSAVRSQAQTRAPNS